MANAALEAIRAKLKEAQDKKNNRESGVRTGGDNASFPFWEMKYGGLTTTRFLPDADKENVFFWVKREVIKLPFDGVVGGQNSTNKPVTVTVPCVDMFGMNCPIIAATRYLWKDKENQNDIALARTYYKKKSYICQGFIVDTTLEEPIVPENPIRRLVLNPSLIEIVEKGLMDPDMEDSPTDYVNGTDFRIFKTQKGDYANYQTSNWARKSRSLSEAEMTAIEQHGLFDLKTYLGAVPDKSGVEIIKAMFEASFAGQPFDHESFGEHYRPYGGRGDNGGDQDAITTAARAALATGTVAVPVQEEAPASVAAPAAPAGSASAHDILERIKNRTVNR
jgi:hypothetical protein